MRTPSNYWQSSDKRQINQKTSVEEAEKRQNERIAPLHNQNTTNASAPNSYPANSSWECRTGEYGWSSNNLTDVVDHCLECILCEIACDNEISDAEALEIHSQVEQKCLAFGHAEGAIWAIWHDSLAFPDEEEGVES